MSNILGENMFLFIAIFMAVCFGLYIFVDKVFLEKRRQQLHNTKVRVLLFEQVGDDKVFRGVHEGKETQDEKMGSYLWIDKIKTSINLVNNSDYFLDKAMGKCLLVCKYSTDDYRVISRLKQGKWFKKEKLPIEKYLETRNVKDEETGEEFIQVVKDDEGHPVPLLDDGGEPLPDYDLVEYVEPLGVTQSDREVMRFNRDFSRRMQEKRGEKSKFWDKYVPMFISVTVVLIAFEGKGRN